MTIIMVTHELDIAHYCRRNLIVRDGRVVRDEAVTDRLVSANEMKKLLVAEAAAKLTETH
jgi:putative ABC transport system ATP-binding protein